MQTRYRIDIKIFVGLGNAIRNMGDSRCKMLEFSFHYSFDIVM